MEPTANSTAHRRGIGLLGVVVVFALAAAVTTGALAYADGGALPGVSHSGITAAQAATPADAQAQTAIQGVIQQGNAEQAQALASGNPALMADTSTDQYLQQLQQINQDMSKNGVASIALVNLEWGAFSLNGTNATATTYETWTTTLTDGTTTQARDENDYSLVQDNNGAWKIASDTHPGDGSMATAPQTSTPGTTAPTGRTPGVATSGNWAGYAATNGSYTAVNGTWTVPDFSAQSSAGVSATWVGIGGVTTTDLIQAGTQQQTSGTGQTEYQAWVEMLPRASKPVKLSVRPGDSVSVSIAEQTHNDWLVSFTNNTTGQTYSETDQYASSDSSAEWIQEAPSAGHAGVLPLDDFGTVSFQNATAVKDGQTTSLSASGAQAITLIGGNRQALAAPSSVGSDGSSFSVTRTANPSVVASPPSRGRSGIGVGSVGGLGGGTGVGVGVGGFGR